METTNMLTNDNIFYDKDYIHYIFQYFGTFDEKLNINPDVKVTLIDKNFAILSVKSNLIRNFNDTEAIAQQINERVGTENFEIVYMQPPDLYSLQEISAIDASQVNSLQTGTQLNLTGKDVLIGIIDTGVDYLNDEFKDRDGKTRINAIWDQTIPSNNNENQGVPFGSIYNNDQINQAIDAAKTGGNPYDIVPSKDENGHGTNMAGIVGGTGKNPNLKGMAPDCEYVIVKLAEAKFYKFLYSIDPQIPVYTSVTILVALKYLREFAIKEEKPMVILLALGSTTGNHKGDQIIDYFIETVSNNVGIVVVTGTGNEGIADGHVSGVIESKLSNESIELLIAESQKDFYVGIWAELPNIINVDLVSPSGQSTGVIKALLSESKIFDFVFEQTEIEVIYDIPEKYAAEQLIRIYFKNIKRGVWKIRLGLQQGKMAVYNAWMYQRDFVKPGTRFTPSDPYGTLTIPGDSDFVITVAAYNQNNNNLLAYSGVGFREDSIKRVDFAAGGVNTMTVGLNNTVEIINGTSLSAAVGAGACALLLQWGIVEGKYPDMYTQSIKTFMRRGTVKRRGDTYPNPQIGYGLISVYDIFQNIT